MKITLGTDPWSLAFWPKGFLEAVEALMSPDVTIDLMSTAYADWLSTQVSDYKTLQRVFVRRFITIQNIARYGYHDFMWKKDKWCGPMSCSLSGGGLINQSDGTTRAAALYLTGKPVELEVTHVHKKWQEVMDADGFLYTPYPHPCFRGASVVRPSKKRFLAIAARLLEMGVEKVCYVGANNGFGADVLSEYFDVDAVDTSWIYVLMMHSLRKVTHGIWGVQCGDVRDMDYSQYDAVVALSVYHHITLNDFRICSQRLAACPIHVVELPHDNSGTWDDSYVTCRKKPSEALLQYMRYTGRYTKEEELYVDEEYEGRRTVVLSRQDKPTRIRNLAGCL